uniref:Dynein axonemal assembly factor 1 homolog n=1 Tax=Culex tarsalis TaxID=7177 RepID=A0A1Q3FT24_CULTA
MVRESAEETFGPKKMTKKSIVESCKKNKLYITPHLNDILYLHYSGYNAIESLEEYVGLKCLWLECNAISTIGGLDNQTQLRCLYLQNNLITKIENLDSCKQLDTLNLSHNYINKIENCGNEILPVLNTLNISHNYLKTADSLDQLRDCHFVSVLDISHNRIEDIAIVKILSDMKALRVLTLTGNPVVNEIPSYRKTLILECKSLTYLDSRPVFDRDRACAEAWKRGGFEEERKELKRWQREEQRKIRRSINATLRMRHKGDGEPELLKTSSDEEEDESSSKKSKPTEPVLEINQVSNEQAWNDVEKLFCKTPSSEGSMGIFQRFKSENRPGGVCSTNDEDEDEEDRKSNRGEERDDQDTFTPTNEVDGLPKKKLIEEIPSDEEKQFDDDNKSTDLDQDCSDFPTESESQNEPKTLVEEIHTEGSEESSPQQELEPEQPVAPTPKNMDKVKSTELEDDTLNVVIENKEDISISLETKEGELISKVESRPSSSQGKKYTVVDVNGSDSEPTEITNEDRDNKSSSLSMTSGTDSSSDEDMFDKIVPVKNRKLATRYQPDSTTSTDSEEEAESPNYLPVNGERDKSIAQYIDEYKKFFRAANVLDSPPNKTRTERPQTAKNKRTEPIIYEGVLKTMEKNSNEAKIHEARAEAKESKEKIIDRLINQQEQIDMDLEGQDFTIGGEVHNFRKYRLDAFRKDQDKLQVLIDRVTAQKDRYNAHIDQIHDQMANIMDDYEQISEKLKKVDDLIQTINDDVKVATRKKIDFAEDIEEIPEELEVGDTSEESDPAEEAKEVAQQMIEHIISRCENDILRAPTPLLDSSSDSSEDSTDDDMAALLLPKRTVLDILSSPKPVPIQEPELEGLAQDPVYQKFIEIQEEIDQLTEDELYNIVTEAAGELSGNSTITQCLNTEVDQYWKQYDNIDDFRKNINLDSHPIIQKFRQFIRCHCEQDQQETASNLDKACRKLERRLSNSLFDEYLILSRKVSIATTGGGESSANELELIEVDEVVTEELVEALNKVTAWDETTTEEPNKFKEDAIEPAQGDDLNVELEDTESKPAEEELPVGTEQVEGEGEAFFTKCLENSDIL